MKQKKVKLCILLLVLGLTVKAQEASVASGGDALGSGGTFAYSVGQITYTDQIGSNGTVRQGLQQAFEISTVLGIENHSINLQLAVYPNPTTNFLNLNIENNELSSLSFQLFDLNGKLIESRKITNTTESIYVENLPRATYFLKVADNNNTIKTFKIIKN